MDLYCIGELLVDFMPGDQPGSYVRSPGGAPANVAVAAARNGLTAGMNCMVGDDGFGQFLLDTLRENGVRPLNSRLCTQAVTTMAFVTRLPGGERAFTFARKPGADQFLSEEDVREQTLEETVMIHAGSFSLSAASADAATRKALRLGHEMGKLVSFDVNYRDGIWNGDAAACREAVMTCLPWIDILKVSEEESALFGGEAAFPALMRQYALTVVVETRGAAGARAWYDGQVLQVPGHPVRCVDATGAGDAFFGGLLSSLRLQHVEHAPDLTREILLRALQYGNAAGALCVQKSGAIPALPALAQIEQFLRGSGSGREPG